MSSLPMSFASTCHSKSCVNGVCKESNECNVTLTNGGTTGSPGGPNTTPNGKTLNATDLPLATDPISEFLAWIQSILDSIFK
jgi:hypothetical protein